VPRICGKRRLQRLLAALEVRMTRSTTYEEDDDA
jgi:hypothetical protein